SVLAPARPPYYRFGSTPPRNEGAMASPPTITYITAPELIRLQPNAKVTVIDVRDEERNCDGHIAGSWHFASDTFVEQLPALAGKLDGQQAVVFHCAKSQ
ncbi:hypothetical protein GOP47_0022061, partial [Adiantum capillus-veneris]